MFICKILICKVTCEIKSRTYWSGSSSSAITSKLYLDSVLWPPCPWERHWKCSFMQSKRLHNKLHLTLTYTASSVTTHHKLILTSQYLQFWLTKSKSRAEFTSDHQHDSTACWNIQSEWLTAFANLIRWGFAWSNTSTVNSAVFAFQMSLLMAWKSQQSQSSCACWRRQQCGFRCGVKSNKQGWTFVPFTQCCLSHLLHFYHPSFNLSSTDTIHQEGDDEQASALAVSFPAGSGPPWPRWRCWLMLSGLVPCWQ